MTAPKRSRRRLIGLVAAGATATAAIAVAGIAGADTPPWQVGGTQQDPYNIGTLSFYDASGNQIFGGNTSDAPLAAYVVGSKVLNPNDTRAALYAYLPQPSVTDPKTGLEDEAAGAWSGTLLTAASTFPVTAAGTPTAISSLTTPVETGTSADESLDEFIADLPNKSTAAGFQNIYELRLRTIAPGHPETPYYDAADIQVTGTTWQVVYPQHFVDTTTSLAVTPTTGVVAGGSVTLTANVSSTDAVDSGTVTFLDGKTSLGTADVGQDGTATKKVTVTTAGTHTFTASYAPPTGSALGTSTGTATETVGKATTKIVGTWPAGKLVYGTKFSVKAAVTAPGITPTGTVTLKSGTKTLTSAALAKGAATLTVPATALTPGKPTLTLSYGGSTSAGTSSTSKALTIGKAASRTTDSVSPARIVKTKRAKFAVSVAATGTTPAGSVTIYDGAKKIATGKLVKGRVTVTLPLLKVGRHSLHAVYGGSTLVATSSGKAVVLTVVT